MVDAKVARVFSVSWPEFDPTIDAFHGAVANTVDTITFEGRSVDELRAAFHQSVDDYLETCERDSQGA